MIGCALLTAAGIFVAARLLHGWHHGRYCGGGWGGWRYGHRRRCGGGGHHGLDGWDEWDDPYFRRGHQHHRFGFEGGPGFVLRRVLGRLDATPAQEQVVRQAVDELREAGAKLRGEGRRTRADLATAFRKSHFDEELFGELYARHDRALEELRKAFVGAGAKIHDALDERQRARLADMIEAGRGWWG
jgi:hypothetical protein